MKSNLVTAILAFCLLVLWSNSCLAGIASISGTVVDAETGEPIEGAVVVFGWDQTKGPPGLTSTVHYKTVETVTDSEGRFSVPRVLNPLVNEPYFVIYKKGYYCWRTEWDPMTDARRKGFSLSSNLTYKMDRHVPGKYLYKHSKALCGTGITGNTPLFEGAISWEHKLVTKEQRLYQDKVDNLTPEEKAKYYIPSELLRSDYKTRKTAERQSDEIQNRLWKEVLQELYISEEGMGNEQ
jgi:hypothetical protein